MRSSLLAVPLLALVLSGCVVTADVMRTDSAARSPREPGQVAILLDEPEEPYTSIALIVASDDGHNLPMEAIKKKLVEEAAKLGAEAVIIGQESEIAAFTAIGTSVHAVKENKLVGRAIVFR